jgi:hypothetical protein
VRLSTALILLHRTYRSFRPSARAHILIRFLTCPFLRILPFIPRHARSLLEVGAGHGVLSRLGAAQGVSFVVAVEPDVRKIAHVDGVRSVIGFDEAIRGTFDVVALADVLYAIPIDDWDALLSRLFERLEPGGTLLIKEQDPSARLKNGWNRIQERISERVLRITMASAFNYETDSEFAARLARHGFDDISAHRIDAWYPHPHLLYVARKPSP